MQKLTILANTAALMLLASTAWACGPTGGELVFLGVILAPLLTFPVTFVGSAAIAWQSREWYAKGKRFSGWFVATLGAWVAASLGGAAGVGLAALTQDLGSSNLDGALVLSTPLVVEIAYLMWLHTRAQRRKLAAVETSTSF